MISNSNVTLIRLSGRRSDLTLIDCNDIRKSSIS